MTKSASMARQVMSGGRLRLGTTTAMLAVMTLVLAGCTGPADQAAVEKTPSQIIKDVTPQEASNLIRDEQASPDFEIIDVRTQDEFVDGHLEGATLIDFYASDFEEKMDRLDKDKSYLIYCRSGARSASARDIMERLGFTEVYNVLGGILRWTDEGFPVVK